ncbi:bacteriohemerythrin [Roseospirillum parvum]|uniref:Hemerythrin n=1 Tax=Roseospirillum parvum TaxID=83401 RepID=A0A1G8ASQ2_9PROT|nr:bacteriohemerythrin [Roseospirillum parvum]SDH23853.1 hemerythrin [Roseospirillum parvum]
MDRMQWKKWFEVGHDAIDFEHKIFFSLIHKLQSLIEVTGEAEAARRVLDETYKYADFHFTSEENIMLESEYPDFERHHELHQALLRRLRRSIDDMDGGLVAGPEVVSFLFYWFVEHTVAEDLKIATHLKERHLQQFFEASPPGGEVS